MLSNFVEERRWLQKDSTYDVLDIAEIVIRDAIVSSPKVKVNSSTQRVNPLHNIMLNIKNFYLQSQIKKLTKQCYV